MNDLFNSIRGKLGGLFPQNNVVSPMPENDTLDDPGKLYYVAQNLAQEEAARRGNARKLGAYEPKLSQPQPTITKTPKKTPAKSVKATKGTSKSKVDRSRLEKIIREGLNKYSKNVPLASASGYLAEAGEQLPDPLLPTLVALIETSGGRNFTRGQNNLYNVLANTGGANYPDYKTAILGGNGRQGFLGTVKNSGYYNDYLENGDLSTFLRHYTPPGAEHGNASMERQIHRYNDLRSNFDY